ncbi:MaoC/PaaZ C-terminal domain-containing protein [Enterobacillus tribolii]|uniref:MaoC dehydratase-like protein n=1 Tax=Enterobacillus tribolii TaxID=1487935 RepID=A0A370R4I7_9GAMM|nr:MaoC/PaaZ C-terminal domain-containing protein [Enterobacillus tribolii]MBW7983279.1 hypothetical protein [Enterobacillus tribolii]RDK97337.1 MaoC dehydratase-like protein [Enterobacillus tribolii]
MIVRYGPQDAQRWATFSGDFNPIHFDLAAAHHIGLPSRAVHGMRAMLDLKQHISKTYLQHTEENAPSLHFSARLKAPLYESHDYHLTSDNRQPQRIRSVIRDAESTVNSIEATLRPAPLPHYAISSPEQTFDPGAREAAFNDATADSSEKLAGWLLPDASLFCCILEAPQTMQVVNDVLPDLGARCLAEVFPVLPMVQTHHDVYFSSTLLSPQSAGAMPLRWHVIPTILMGNRNEGFIFRMGAQGSLSHREHITVLITLKTWPLL